MLPFLASGKLRICVDGRFGFFKEKKVVTYITSSVFSPHIQMISPGFQRSLSAGEVAGLSYGFVMDARYCQLCLGAGQILSLLWESPSWSTFRFRHRGAFGASHGMAADEAGVFFSWGVMALLSDLGIWLKWGFTYPHPSVCFNQFLHWLLCLFFLCTIWCQEERLVVHQEDESAGAWIIRATIVLLKVRGQPVLQPFSLGMNLSI